MLPPRLYAGVSKLKVLIPGLETEDLQNLPNIFYVTQHKCASQWLAQILRWFAYNRFVPPLSMNDHFMGEDVTLIKGMLYPTLYISKCDFDNVIMSQSQITKYHLFIVIRDLRDILTSLYFSVKNSHPLGFQGVDDERKILQNMSAEDGLIYIMNSQMNVHYDRQRSWLEEDSKIYRYEDIIKNDNVIYDILSFCEINVKLNYFNKVMKKKFKFEKLAGRTRGNEDVNHHYRRGVEGDWKNHFSERVKDEFKNRFNDVLVSAGYVQNDQW